MTVDDAPPAAATPHPVSSDAAAQARLDGVGKTYGSGDTAVHALRDVTLSLRPGEVVAVLGPSGSGKTTLLNVLGALEPATTGRVVLGGHDLSGLRAEQLATVRRHTLSFVFQFFNLVPTLTAWENVALVAELVGDDGGPSSSAVDEVLAAVGLTDRADRFPAQLSGGQQQRVAIARALVTAPRLLLCDEPTGSLDLDTGVQVLGLLVGAARQADRAVVIVTHNSAIAGAADRVVRMRSGEVVDDRRNPEPVPAADVIW